MVTCRLRHLPISRPLRLLILALVFGVVVAMPEAVAQSNLRCADCGNRITKRYWEHDGQTICDRCHLRRAPSCDTCGKKLVGRFVISGDKNYCDQRCFEASLPTCGVCQKPVRQGASLRGVYYCSEHTGLPRCTGCDLPQSRFHKLADGRIICALCKPHAVTDPDLAQRLYDRAVKELEAATGYRSDTIPTMHMVDAEFLREKHRETGIRVEQTDMVERGLYMREEVTLEEIDGNSRQVRTDITETIYLLSHIRRRDFAVVAAHELTHDMLREKYPAVEQAPHWVEEGICQYTAAMVARQIQAKDALADIELMTDPVYGEGYHFFKARFGENNWNAVQTWLRATDLSRLPKRAPRRTR